MPSSLVPHYYCTVTYSVLRWPDQFHDLHLVEFLLQLSRCDVLAREKLHEQVFAFAQLRGVIRFVLTPRFFPKPVPFEFLVEAAMTPGMSASVF